VDLVVDGVALAEPELAHSVHVNAEHLQPDNLYWYRFTVGDRTSPVGRTRTTPTTAPTPASCGSPSPRARTCRDGYWTAYGPHGRRGRRPRLLPGRLHLRGRTQPRRGADLPHAGPRPTWRRTASAGRTTRATRRCRRSTSSSPGSSRGTTTRSRTTTPPTAPRTPPQATPQPASGSSSAAPRRTRRSTSTSRCGSIRPTAPTTRSTASSPGGKLARFYVLDGRQYRSKQECLDQVVLSGAGPLCEAAEPRTARCSAPSRRSGWATRSPTATPAGT
jgi:hypothetical protein